MKLRKPATETSLLMVVYGLVFVYLIFQEAIFTFDSYGYLLAMPQRNPGYVVFIKFFEFIFPNNFARVLVGVQLLLGLFGVHVCLKRLSKFLNLNYFLQGLVLICLLFPFFPPLLIANNICSEGLTYPLYLLFIVKGVEFLYHEKSYTLITLLVLYILLALTRGQFLVTSLIFAFVYFFKYRSNILNKKFIWRFILLLLFPLIVIFADKTYHKLKDGLFISTPYTFVNVSTAPFYVSHIEDANLIESTEYRKLFIECHEKLSEKKLLMSSNKWNGFDDAYQFYHDHLPQICNQTFYAISRKHYFDAYMTTHTDEKAAAVYSLVQSELFSKSMFFTLIKPNFKDWASLYYSNIVHGFKSVVLLIFVIVIFLFSGFKVIFKSSKNYNILFICAALTLSNAMIISLASHSIMRYLFYNYLLILLMVIILLKIFSNVKRS